MSEKSLKIYRPMPKFPPLSLSGTQCQLNCLHCSRSYLRGMDPVETPEALLATCRQLANEGAIGVLLSGGSTRHGAILNLKENLDAIRQVKEETDLILNVHPGLLDDATARALTVDFASLEIPSDATIREVFRLDATRDDYVATYDRLQDAGVNVVPHVSVYDGSEAELLAEIAAPERVAPDVIVVIVFSPTQDTPLADAAPPTPEMLSRVIGEIGQMFPAAEIALGCMRPRDRSLRDALEMAALEAGATRMELPSRRTLAAARDRGYDIVRLDACCALPTSLEPRARRSK